MYRIGTSSSLKARIISTFLAIFFFLISGLLIVFVKAEHHTKSTAYVALASLIISYLILLIGTCKENLEQISLPLKKFKEEILQALIELSN